MESIIICAEGANDIYLITKLINSSLAPLTITLGSVSALTKIQSLSIHTSEPILLVMDSDSTDSFKIEERYDYLVNSLYSKNIKNKLKIILFNPEIEIIFLKVV
jgi:hypothetical protein